MTKPKTSIKSVRLPDDVWEKIAVAAEGRGIKVNAAMAEAAERWLSNPLRRLTMDEVDAKFGAPLVGTASTRAEALAQRQAAEAERTAGWFNPKGRK